MRRRPQVDAVLQRPEVRADLEELKRLIGLSADRYGARDPDGHEQAALQSSVAGWRIVKAVLGDLEPDGPTRLETAVFAYVVNVAQHELLDGLQGDAPLRVQMAELQAAWPPGRRRGRRPTARQQLIEEVRARPGISDWRIADRARELGVWAPDQANDPANRRRRIARIRRDAAN